MTDLATYGVSKGAGRYHEEVLYTLALIYNIASSEIASYLKDYDLTTGKLNILIAIKHHGGDKGIPQVEISKHLIVTPSNMTKLIDKLEKEKMVIRTSLPGDRRVNIIKITKKGTALLDRIWKGYDQKLKRLSGELTKEKQQRLSALLLEWFEKLKKE